MKKLAALIAMPLILITLAGCTTRVQCIKDVYLDGKGGLVVSYVTLKHSDMLFLFLPTGKLVESGNVTTKTFYIGEYQEKKDTTTTRPK